MMKLPLALLLALPFSAFAQFQVGTEELPSTSPDVGMPAGKIAIDRTTMPARWAARSDAQLLEISCTGTPGVGSCAASASPEISTVADGVTANGGQFRIGCSFSHVAFDDPIIWPGRKGRTHLHQFFGNDSTDAFSSTADFATVGKSTCKGGLLNRSAYWFPVMVYECVSADDLAGTAPRTAPCDPDRNGEVKIAIAGTGQANFYYKTQSSETDPMPSDSSSYGGLPMQWAPSGLAMITGCYVNTSCLSALSGNHYIQCMRDSTEIGTAGAGQFRHIPSTAQALAIAGGGGLGCNRLKFNIGFPRCWNGVDLTSPNGKDHMSSSETSTACALVDHIMFPSISLNIYYEITNADMDYFRLSSDLPRAEAIVAGCTSASNYCAAYTSHADWVNGWDQSTIIVPSSGGSWGMTIVETIMDQCYNINNPPANPLSSDCHNELVGNPLGDSNWWRMHQ
jgi:hypothetical protein